MRIPRLQLQLGALLLSLSLLDSGAFTPNALVRSNLVRSNPAVESQYGGRFVFTPYMSSGSDSDDIITRQESQDLMEKTGERTGNVSNLKDRLPWIFMLVLLMYSQFTGGTSVIPIDSSSQKDVVYSTVSATLIRGSSSKGRLSGQNLILALFMGWQILAQSGNLTKLLWVAGTKFSALYMTCLCSFPLYTKAVTAAIISFLGDSTAQAIEEMKRARRERSRFTLRNYDRRRGLAKFADSIFITGPMLHFAYGWLEHMIPVSGATNGLSASLAAILQVLIDDFIFDAIFVAIMFVTTGIGEGCAKHIIPQLKSDYAKAVKTSWATSLIVMPLEFACFRFLPLSFRVLGMNLIDIIWEGMVSYMIHRKRKREGIFNEIESSESIVQIPNVSLLQAGNAAA